MTFYPEMHLTIVNNKYVLDEVIIRSIYKYKKNTTAISESLRWHHQTEGFAVYTDRKQRKKSKLSLLRSLK